MIILRLIGKCVVDFLLVLIELFRYVLRLRRYTSECPFKIGDFARGPVNQKFQVEVVHSSSQKIRLNDLSFGIEIWTDLSFVLSQCTLLTDRRTCRRTKRILIGIPRLHSTQRGKNDNDNIYR